MHHLVLFVVRNSKFHTTCIIYFVMNVPSGFTFQLIFPSLVSKFNDVRKLTMYTANSLTLNMNPKFNMHFQNFCKQNKVLKAFMINIWLYTRQSCNWSYKICHHLLLLSLCDAPLPFTCRDRDLIFSKVHL
jgi:hypothetical protein